MLPQQGGRQVQDHPSNLPRCVLVLKAPHRRRSTWLGRFETRPQQSPRSVPVPCYTARLPRCPRPRSRALSRRPCPTPNHGRARRGGSANLVPAQEIGVAFKDDVGRSADLLYVEVSRFRYGWVPVVGARIQNRTGGLVFLLPWNEPRGNKPWPPASLALLFTGLWTRGSFQGATRGRRFVF